MSVADWPRFQLALRRLERPTPSHARAVTGEVNMLHAWTLFGRWEMTRALHASAIHAIKTGDRKLLAAPAAGAAAETVYLSDVGPEVRFAFREGGQFAAGQIQKVLVSGGTGQNIDDLYVAAFSDYQRHAFEPPYGELATALDGAWEMELGEPVDYWALGESPGKVHRTVRDLFQPDLSRPEVNPSDVVSEAAAAALEMTRGPFL